MRPPTEGQPTGWGKLRAEQQQEVLAVARRIWSTTEASRTRPWDFLSPQQQRFAALTMAYIEEAERDPFSGTRSCPECLERVIVPHGDRSWFCQTCKTALQAEGAHWRDLRNPGRGRSRVKSVKGWKGWSEYQTARPIRAHKVEAEIADVIARERRRKGDQEERED